MSEVKLDNKYNASKVKQALDDSIVEHMLQGRGGVEDNRLNDWRLAWGALACGVALFAHFGPVPWPANKPLLAVCVAVYAIASAVLQLTQSRRVRDDILVTRAASASSSSSSAVAGLAVSTTLERLGPNYTIRVRPASVSAAAESGASAAQQTLVASIARWIDSNGVVRKDILAADIDRLADAAKKAAAAKKTN